MYESYFGLTERPFSIAPDPHYLYMSSRHKEAMAHLSYGLSQGGCFIVLTGEVGTGKTTLCRNLLTDLPTHVDVALILNPNLGSTELLQTVCDELKITYEQTATQKLLLDLINGHLLNTFSKNRHTVLIIDEAQLLTRNVLEQIRLLTNLETTKSKLLQIILIGQPELYDLLSRNDLRQLAQRVTARYHLGALERNEIEEYVNYRLNVAGCKQPIFSRQALNKLHSLSEGIPRKINVLADHSLLATYSQGATLVEAKTVAKAAKEVFIVSKKAPMVRMPSILNFSSSKSESSVYDFEESELKLNRVKSSSVRPSSAKPSGTRPSSTKPSSTKPSSTKPSSTKPSSTKPSSTKPSGTRPSSAKPSSTKSSSTKPSGARPSSTRPSSTKPSSTKPSGTRPSSTKPSSTKPSSTKPSSTKPSGTRPSSTKPSSTKPSGTRPSGTRPSGTRPSSSKPSSSRSGDTRLRSRSSSARRASSSKKKVSILPWHWAVLVGVLVALNLLLWWIFFGSPEPSLEVVEPATRKPAAEVVVSVVEPKSVIEVKPEPVDDLLLESGPGSVVVSDTFLTVDDELPEVQKVLSATQITSNTEVSLTSGGIPFSQDSPLGKKLDVSGDVTGRVAALRRLALGWQIELPAKLLQSVCKSVAEQDLKCLSVKSIDSLVAYNRPAVILLEHNQRVHRVIVQSLTGSVAVLGVGLTQQEVSLEEIKQRWAGDGLIYWRPSFPNTSFLKKGDTGAVVKSVRSQLNIALSNAQLALLSDEQSNKFDDDMESKVKLLQLSYALVGDGLIGNQTYLFMNELTAPESTPVLRRRLRTVLN